MTKRGFNTLLPVLFCMNALQNPIIYFKFRLSDLLDYLSTIVASTVHSNFSTIETSEGRSLYILSNGKIFSYSYSRGIFVCVLACKHPEEKK